MSLRELFNYALIAAATVTVAACEAPDDSLTGSQDIDRQRVLRRGNGGEPQTLDPAIAEDVHAFSILSDLYEGLIIEAGDGTLLPGVAERWEVSPDGRRYTFYLRDDAIWSNGDPVTSRHFVAAFHRVLTPGTISAYSFLLEPLLNYQAVISGEKPPAELGIHVVDDKTLTMELHSPAQHFPGILAMPIAYPEYGSDDARKFRDPELFVGNGPYVLEQWSIGQKIRLKKNPNYRNANAITIQFVEYFPITDSAAELNMFRAGELDITFTVPAQHIAKLSQSQSDTLQIAPSLALYYLAFDLSEPPLTDTRLRQALSMAIDRQVIVQVLGRGEQAAFGLVPPGVANHISASYEWRHWTANEREAKARSLLKEAGHDSNNPLQLLLTYDTGDVHEKIALAVSSMWRDVLAIEVELQKKEWKYFLATRDDRSAWQVMRFAWTGDYNDPSTFTDIFRSGSQQNLPGFRNPKYDRLLDEAGEQINLDDRAKIMSTAESVLLEDYPIAPLYFYVSKHLVSERVQNFQTNILDRHPTQFLRLQANDQK